MFDLIPAPDLDLRDEEQLAAEAISRVTGNLDIARIDAQIALLRSLRQQVQGGLDAPICPELTNANPSSPHTVLLETQAWLVAQLSRRINVLPVRDQIEFARLFGIELRAATKATTILTFTTNAPAGVVTTVPTGTEVTSTDNEYVFKTDAELKILSGQLSGEVSATRTISGRTVLLPNTLVVLPASLAWVTSVTNLPEISSGSNDETIEQALVRARNYQRRGERLVSAKDFEDAVRDEILYGNGIVRAFPFIADADWTTQRVGHTTIVVMTADGGSVGDDVKIRINELLTQMVGNQFIHVLDPTFVDFTVAAAIQLKSLVSPTATAALVERNLREFYAARLGKFGAPALRSEIIAIIEGSAGVERIVPQAGGSILAAPAADVVIAPYELVRLLNVIVNIV
jgi:hypothetical protein